MDPSFARLNDREKEALRLLARGHDAKSAARALNVSTNSINERLRDARHKLGVSSSREAARVLVDAEGAGGQEVWDEKIGLYGRPADLLPVAGPGRERRASQIAIRTSIGVGAMILLAPAASALMNPFGH